MGEGFSRYDFGKNAVVVARVSTPLQTASPQIADLVEYAHQLGYEKIKTFGTTESGFLEYDDKQGWNNVVDFFETHSDYKVLICSEISRLSRVKSILMQIEEYLIKNKIQLIIKDISFSLFNEWGRVDEGKELVFSLYSSLANSEMRQKKERFKRAQKELKAQGYALGGKELFGYTRSYVKVGAKNRSVYQINEKEAEEIRQVYRWYAYGIDNNLLKTSIRTITLLCIEKGFSQYLHSKRNVNKTLKEEAYIGRKESSNRVKNPEYWNYKKKDAVKYVQGETYLRTYPPIFTGEDEGLFYAVQERLKANNSKLNAGVSVDKSRKHINILAKLVRCPDCGHYLQAEYRNHKDGRFSAAYRCVNSRASLKNCSFKHTLSVPLLDSVVWACCRRQVAELKGNELRQAQELSLQEIVDKIKNIKDELVRYDESISNADAILSIKLRTLTSDSTREKALDEYEKRLKDIEKNRKDLDTRLSELTRERERLLDARGEHTRRLLTGRHIEHTKKEIYDYVHKLVKSIDVLYTDARYTLLDIKMYDDYHSKYVWLNKRNTLNVSAYMIGTYKYWNIEVPNMKDVPLEWNRQEQMFVCGDYRFGVVDIYQHLYVAPCVVAPVTFASLGYKKLKLYDEDM